MTTNGTTYRDAQDRILRAEDALESGDIVAARTLFLEAATIQKSLLDILPPDRVRTKSVYGASAAALFYKAAAIDECQRLALRLLAEPWIEDYSAGKLRGLLQQIWHEYAPKDPNYVRTEQADVLGVRLVRRDNRSRLSLRNAPEVFRSLFRLFAFGASVEHFPSPYYERPSRQGLLFAHGLDITPAEVRSFSFTVESALNNNALSVVFNDNMDDVRTFRRNVMARVVRGLHKYSDPSAVSNLKLGLSQEYERRFNANMATSLVTLYQQMSDGAAELEFSIQWSAGAEVPGDLRDVSTIRYDEQAVQKASLLVGAMKRDQAKVPVNLSGRITSLKDVADEEQLDMFELFERSDALDGEEPELTAEYDKDRVVTLKNYTGRGPRHVYFSLDEERYRLACDAHKEKRTVYVRGLLQKRAGRWVLDPCEHFGLTQR